MQLLDNSGVFLMRLGELPQISPQLACIDRPANPGRIVQGTLIQTRTALSVYEVAEPAKRLGTLVASRWLKDWKKVLMIPKTNTDSRIQA